MDSIKIGNIIGGYWNDILIANWYDKEWFEATYDVKLTEEEYKNIVELYNDSNMCDVITEEIEDWIRTNNIIKLVKRR